MEKKMSKKDPFVRITKRTNTTKKQRILIRLICILSAIVLSVIFITVVSQKNPIPAIGYIFLGSFKNSGKIWSFIQEVVLLLGIALALTPAYKMKFWNVGAQGQILMGSLGTAVVMIYFSNLPSVVVILISLVFSIICGAIWAFIPAFFKAKWNTNETLFTLMMNYIAIRLISFLTKIWSGNNSSMGMINKNSRVGWLYNIAGNKVLLPLIYVLILIAVMYFYINKTKHGYEVQVVGESVNTARYSGIKVKNVIIRTLILSGALCGVIGFFYTAGFDHTISPDTSGGYGFTAIIVCWLAHFNPLLMIVYAALIVFLNKGAINLKNSSYSPALNEYSCETIVLLIVIAIMLAEFFINYRLIFRKKETISLEEVTDHE